MAFKKQDGNDVSITSEVSTNDMILVSRNDGSTNQATLQTFSDGLGFFTSADASATIAAQVSAQVSAGDFISSAEASAVIAAQISAGNYISEASASTLISDQISAGGYLTSALTTAQAQALVDAETHLTTAEVQALIDAETHLTTAEVSSIVETYGYTSTTLTTAEAQALVDAETHLTTAEVSGIVETYGYATLTTAQADAFYTTTAQAQALVDAETHLTTAEVSGIVETYGFITEALTTAQADARYYGSASADSYGGTGSIPVFTVNAQGQITTITQVSAAGGGGAVALNDLTDVSVGTPTDSYVLTYELSATQWRPKSTGDIFSGQGTDSVLISPSTAPGFAINSFDVAIGPNAIAGASASASDTLNTAIGASARATGRKSTALGFDTNADGRNGVAIGDSARAGGSKTVAIGNTAVVGTTSAHEYSVGIGSSIQVLAEDSFAVGHDVSVAHANAIVFGKAIASDFENQVKYGSKILSLGEFNTSALETDNNTAAHEGGLAYNSQTNKAAYRNDSTWVDLEDTLPVTITSVSANAFEFTKNHSLKELIIFEAAAAVSVRVPTCASVSMAVGSQIDFIQYGAGQVTINPTVGVSVVGTGTALRAQYSAGTITKIKPDTWSLVGDLEQP
jgi:hypothetical protein